MSATDPYGPPGPEDTRRARHTGAAPDAYVPPPTGPYAGGPVAGGPAGGSAGGPAGGHTRPDDGRPPWPADDRTYWPDGPLGDEPPRRSEDADRFGPEDAGRFGPDDAAWFGPDDDRGPRVGERSRPSPADESPTWPGDGPPPWPGALDGGPGDGPRVNGGGPGVNGGDPAGGDPVPEPPKRHGPGRRRASVHRPATVPSRAGRNLPAAIAVGLLLGALILVPLFLWDGRYFVAVLAVAVWIGIWEVGRAVRSTGARPPLVPLVAGGILMIGLAWFVGPDALSLGLLATVVAAMVWRLADGPAGYQRDLTASALIAVYVPFLTGFAALLAVEPDGEWRILATLACVVLSDTGGYAAGVFLGKHAMAPSISPKKSWEGFGGSVAAAAIGGALLLYFLFDAGLVWGAIFGIAVCVAAVLGDLAESMIKRDLGVKDMSNLLPGHGGLMDRFDSVLFALPTAYLLLSVFAPVTSA